jgi:hypothetical protein
MIKIILIAIIIASFLLVFGATIGSILGIIDLSVLTSFTMILGDVLEAFTTQFDLLLTSFPLTLTIMIVLMGLSLMGLVVSSFEKK